MCKKISVLVEFLPLNIAFILTNSAYSDGLPHFSWVLTVFQIKEIFYGSQVYKKL